MSEWAWWIIGFFFAGFFTERFAASLRERRVRAAMRRELEQALLDSDPTAKARRFREEVGE